MAAALLVSCVMLAGVGAVTAVLLQLRAERSLDDALLAAGFAEAHPWQEERFVNAYVNSPVQVRPWSPEDPLVSRRLYESALAQERPLFADIDGQRVLLLVVERAELTSDHRHFVVVASAPGVQLSDAALPFLANYGAVALVALGVAGLALWMAMGRALRPLEAATAEVEAVRGLGSQARVGLAGVDEVDQLLGSTNALLERLEAAFDAQSTFTAQAAHELRTPVTVLKGELELALRRERSPEAYRETIARAVEEADRLSELVEGLMLLARVDAGHADRGREHERLSEAVHRALTRERRVLEQAGCVVSVVLDDDPEVWMHVALVAAAVANLLRNAAVHASGQPVRVTVGCSGDEGFVRISDGGPGLDAETRIRVLERFQRASTRRDGLGLGLPLAREIARRHGGDLVLDGGESGGLIGTLTLSCNSNLSPRSVQGTAA